MLYEPMSVDVLFLKINKIALYLIVFFIPLFFLPSGQDFLEFPKQLLLIILLFFSFLSWGIGQISRNKVIIKRGPLPFFLTFFLLVSFGLSVFFSFWPKASFFGWPLDIADSFITFCLFLLLSFLLYQSFQIGEILKFLFLLLFSIAISTTLTLIHLYKPFLPNIVSTIGGITNFSLAAVVFFPLSFFLFFLAEKKWQKFFFLFLSFLLFIIIIFVNFKTTLLFFIFTLFLISALALKFIWEKGKIFGLFLTMFFLIVSLFFLLFPLKFKFFPNIPLDVAPSFHSEMNILKGVFSEGMKKVFFGSGPGTFVFLFSKFRPLDLNQSIFWNLRFSRGSSTLFDWLITKGIFGGAFLILLLIFGGYFAIFNIKNNQFQKKEEIIKLALSISFLVFILSTFFYSFNLSVWFLFWTILSMVLLFKKEELIEIKLLPSPKRTWFFNVILLILIIVMLGLFFFQTRKYLADIYYLEGIKRSQEGKIEQAISLIEKAIEKFDSEIDFYYRDLSQLYLNYIPIISQKDYLTPDQKRQLTAGALKEGIKNLEQAIKLAPFNVVNWNVRGFFYRNFIGVKAIKLNGGEIFPDQEAIASYQKAIELEPSSPFPYGELSRVYILMAQEFDKQKLEKEKQEHLSLALEYLNKSLNLKPDYALAHYLLAVVYDQQGKTEKAIEELGIAKSNAVFDAGLPFQRGLLFWRQEKIEEAEKEFKEAIEKLPDFSNAHYMLGLVYYKKGEIEKAKTEFEKVTKLNPENNEIKKILENLEKGLPLFEGVITPPHSFLKELPPETEIQEKQ